MRRIIKLLIRFYQLVFSPFVGQHCRFYPTCSDYAMEAVERHGSIKGSWLAVRRLCRCHPWHAGGLDPVPGTKSELESQPKSNLDKEK